MPNLNRITLVIENLPDGHAQVHVDIPSPRPGMRLETAAHALAIDAVGWLGKQPAVAGFIYGMEPTAKAATSLIPPMTSELKKILGLTSFQCYTFALALRMGGHDVPRKVEEEQAAVLHWMLAHYLTHGDEWRTHALNDVDRMCAHWKAKSEGAAA